MTIFVANLMGIIEDRIPTYCTEKSYTYDNYYKKKE